MAGVMMKPKPSSLLYDDDSDEGGIQLHGALKLKNVLYYKDHRKRAIPKAKGTLILGPQTLSFQSKGLDYCWNLDSISAERFKGRVKGGFKILGQRQTRKEENNDPEEDEFVFTNVKQRSYDIICACIDEAKFDIEMKKARLSSMETISNNMDGEMSKSLSVRVGEKPKPSPILKPFRIILLVIVRLISCIFKLFTGRRLFGPKNVPQALHGVLLKVSPILKVANMTLSKRRVMAIEKDTKSIWNSLLTLQRVVQRQQSQFLSRGLVVDGGEDIDTTLEYGKQTLRWARSSASYFFFSIRKTFNMPRLFRSDILQPYEYPSTVGQAVLNANDKLLALMELLAENVDNDSSGDLSGSQIMEEAKHIQMLLYNIKVHAASDASLGPLSPQKEE